MYLLNLSIQEAINKVDWDKVLDYASDETTVDLLGKNRKVLYRCAYYRFTKEDFDKFKKQTKK